MRIMGVLQETRVDEAECGQSWTDAMAPQGTDSLQQ